MASLGKMESLIPVTSAFTITVTDSGGTATGMTAAAAADYYLTSSTSLLTTIGTNLTNNGTLAGTYSLTLDDTNDSSTGKVTLSATGGGNISVTWVSTTLRDILGFTGNLSGAASYTGDNQALYLHLPGCGRSESMSPLADVGTPYRDGNIVYAPGSDASYAMTFATRYRDRLSFSHLLGSNTWTSLEVVTNEALQTFWTYGLSKGYPFRWHSDRNVDGTYQTWRATNAIAEFGAQPVVASWVGAKSLWRVAYDVIKYTT